ncbi:MAG: hypothetical protein IKV69_00570, partial [Clostridia bacterium]|nr:hypothetical protein [Clostridia bacterium]
LGYQAKEVVEEFLADNENGTEVLVKKKCTTKHMPPDVTAIKILLSYYDEKTFEELENMTDEELLAEKDKLLLELQKFEKQKEKK